MQDKISDTDRGLRDRKRANTHARIQAEGLRLFLERGFEATTLDEVAEAAEVSRRTLLNYFGSKEEIVLSAKAGFPQQVADPSPRGRRTNPCWTWWRMRCSIWRGSLCPTR